jgi:deazaflavin-dependent oxidoreductase (nitroreductase family)
MDVMTTVTRPRRDNGPVLRLLASPLHPLLSSRVCTLSYVGARTGTRHVLPVEYARDGDRIVVLAANASTKHWWRNFTGAGRTLTVTIRRHAHVAHAVALSSDDPGYADALIPYQRHHRAPQDTDHRLVVIRMLSA